MQTGSMSAAGRLLCITPSAVSKVVAHTELQLGYRLFIRTPAGLQATSEGQVLAAESGSLHRQLDTLQRTARNLANTERGDVRLAAIPSITHDLLPTLIQRHAQKHPQVGVEVRTIHQDQMTQALLTRSVDFGLGFFEHPHPQVHSELLVSGRLSMAVSRTVWDRIPRGAGAGLPDGLAKVPAIRLVGDDPMRPFIDKTAERLGTPCGPNIQVQTSGLALELVRLGMGWTVIGFLTAIRLDPAQVVVVQLPELPPLSLYSYHTCRQPRGLPATRMLAMMSTLLHEVLCSKQQEPSVLRITAH